MPAGVRTLLCCIEIVLKSQGLLVVSLQTTMAAVLEVMNIT